MVEHDVVALGLETLRSLGDGRIIDLIHAVGGHLGYKHLRNAGQALVEGGVHPGDDQQEQKQQHKVDLPGEDQAGPHQDGGGYPQAHDDAGRVDKDAGAQRALNGDLLMVIDLLVEPGQIARLLVGGADLPDIFQRLLDAVGDMDRGLFRPLRGPGGDLPGAEQQAEGHRHPPQAGYGQPPIVHQQAHRDDRRGDVGPVQVSQHMGPDVLHAIHIAHEGLGEIRQIPLAEVAQGQLAQPLRQIEAGGLDLIVDKAVSGLVLLQVGHEGQDDECDYQPKKERRAGQRRSVRQGSHQAVHQQVQDAHAAHDDQIDNDRPESALFGVFHALVGEGVFALKVFAEHLLHPSLTVRW